MYFLTISHGTHTAPNCVDKGKSTHSSPLAGRRSILDDCHRTIDRVTASHEIFAQLLQAPDSHQKNSRFLRVKIADVGPGVVLPIPGAQGHLLRHIIIGKKRGKNPRSLCFSTTPARGVAAGSRKGM